MPIKTSRLLSHRSMFCASHRIVVMAVAIVEETDLSVPRRLGTRWQVGDTTLRLAGRDLGDRASSTVTQ